MTRKVKVLVALLAALCGWLALDWWSTASTTHDEDE